MSGSRIIYLHCDGCDAVWSIAPNPFSSGQPGDSLTDQRKDARRDGWKVSQAGGQDFCGECSEASR